MFQREKKLPAFFFHKLIIITTLNYSLIPDTYLNFLQVLVLFGRYISRMGDLPIMYGISLDHSLYSSTQKLGMR